MENSLLLAASTSRKRQFRELEYDLTALRNRHEKEKLEWEVREFELTQMNAQLQTRIEQLERDRRLLHERELNSIEKIKEAEEKVDRLNIDAEQKQKALQRANDAMREQLLEFKADFKLRENQLEQEWRRAETQWHQAEQTASHLQNELDKVKELTNRQQQQITQLKLANVAAHPAEVSSDDPDQAAYLSYLKTQLEDQMKVTKKVQVQLKAFVLENEQLKSSKMNVDLLREEKRAMESKLSQMDKLRTRISVLEIELALLRKEKLEWSSFVDSQLDMTVDGPHQLARALAAERLETQSLRDRIQQLQAWGQERESEMKRQLEKFESVKEYTEQLQRQHTEDVAALHRLESLKELARKESQFLRELLKSYDTEEAVMMSDNYDQQKTLRIQQLETLVEELKRQLDVKPTQDQSITADSNELMTTEEAEKWKAQVDEMDLALRLLQKEKRLVEMDLKSRQEQIDVLTQALLQVKPSIEQTGTVKCQEDPE